MFVDNELCGSGAYLESILKERKISSFTKSCTSIVNEDHLSSAKNNGTYYLLSQWASEKTLCWRIGSLVSLDLSYNRMKDVIPQETHKSSIDNLFNSNILGNETN